MAEANPKKNLHKIYEDLPCPNCSCADKSKVKTTIFGHGAFIRICSVCGWSVGIDDSANLCDLGTKHWMFEVTSDSVDKSCLKNHSHVPTFVGLNAEKLMQSICIKCFKTGVMFSVESENGDVNDKDAPICDLNETLRIIFETNLQENSAAQLNNPISDRIQDEIASIVDQKSDEMIAILLSSDYAEETKSSLTCQCGRKECPECRTDLLVRTPHSSDYRDKMATVEDTSCDEMIAILLNIDESKQTKSCFERQCGRRECSKCRSDLFARTPQLSSASELSKGKDNLALHSEEKIYVRKHVRVTNLKQLQPGDHIAWDRFYAIWHHAIVEHVDTNKQEVRVIHNSGGLKDKPNDKFASVRRDTVKVNCEREFLYVYQYSEEDCYPPEEVIVRATESLDTTYDPFKYNCEHFARWCKAGMKCCLQLKDFFDRLKMGSSGLVKFVEEWVMVALRIFGNSETMTQILATGARGARAAIKAQLGQVAGSTTLFRCVRIGTIIGSIALAVATEVIFFICKMFEAKKQLEKREMPWDEFQRLIVQLIFEGLFGLGGGLAVGYGCSMIPYVGVFLSPLGYILGNWIGRLLGAIFGRFVARRLPNMGTALCGSS